MSESSSRVIAGWLERFPEKSSWCRNEQVCQEAKGLCKERKIPKIRDYYGSGWVGWVQVSLGIFFVENHPKIALNQYRYFGVVYHMYSVCIYIVKSC